MFGVGAADRHRKGFTLLEVMCATIILSLGLVALLTAFMQCQRIMRTTQGFETAQYVLMLGETLYPLPSPDLVTDDPLDSDLLNISEEHAEDLCDQLEIDLSPKDRQLIAGYSVMREVDEIDDEEIERNGGIYTVRTTVKWGGNLRGMQPEEEVVVKLWWKGSGGGGGGSGRK